MLKDDWVADDDEEVLKDSASAWRDHGQAGVNWYQVILATTNNSARTITELRKYTRSPPVACCVKLR